VLDYTATGGGYYEVTVDGALLSKHLTEREAIENANVAKLANPSADVRYRHNYEVVVDLNQQQQITVQPAGTPLNFVLRASDPTAVSISGMTVTLLDDDKIIEIWAEAI
jgi:hypothetical protein